MGYAVVTDSSSPPPPPPPPPPSDGSPFFTDGFESGDLSRSENGFFWGGGKGSANVRSTTLWPRTGTHSAQFTFSGNGGDINADAWAQLGYAFPPVNPGEIWGEYYIYFPDGSENGGTFNRYESLWPEKIGGHKLFRIWGDDYDDDLKMGFSASVANNTLNYGDVWKAESRNESGLF